jgi:hypothetical protein
MKWHIYLVIGILLISALILSGCGSGGGGNTQTGSTTQTTTFEGQVVVITYSSTSAEDMAGKWSFSPPRPGYFFLVVSLNIENHGYNEVSVSQFFFTITIDGKEYNNLFVNGLPDKLVSATLRDNDSTSGNLAFEVPEGSSDFTIKYKYESSFNVQWIKE